MNKYIIKFSLLTLGAMSAAFPLMANQTAEVKAADSRYTDPSTLEDRGALTNTDFVKADNTALNQRDRDLKSITPLNQGNSPADIEMTAAIRRDLMADKRLSTDAKNIKVITIDGRVTLRGPVKTSEEKRIISEITGQLANRDYVDDQLDVVENA